MRLWTIAAIAKEFGLSPAAVARELDGDLGELAPICLGLIRYAEAKRAWDGIKDKSDLGPWEGSRMMAAVTRNVFDLAGARRAKAQAAAAAAAEG